VRFVFDQHDLCPELYESRFPEGPRLPHRALRFLERRTYRAADHVIATNDSYRAVAMGRGTKRPEDVTVVRTGPDPTRLRPGTPEPALRRGHRFMAAYIGVMGPQDGVDLLLKAADHIVHTMGRTDVAFVLIGSGDCFDELVDLARGLGLEDHVEFTGRAPDELVSRVMSTADLGLSPDPKNPLNDVSTMNKTMEYMSFALPVVAFDLWETRVSAGDAAVYAEPNVVERYAEAIVDLLDDEPRRRRMGAIARARVEDELAWHHQADRYVAVYRALIGPHPTEGAEIGPAAGTGATGSHPGLAPATRLDDALEPVLGSEAAG
jgi:glycosyltransferase involved in cell wall biosynthesis